MCFHENLQNRYSNKFKENSSGKKENKLFLKKYCKKSTT